MDSTTKEYIYFSPRQNLHIQINFILTSKNNKSKLQNEEIRLTIFTDQSWVSCEFHITYQEKREYNWTLNRNLLQIDLLKLETTQAIQ